MSCGKLAPDLSAYVDHALGAPERGAIDAHLGDCEPCRARVASLRALKHAIARLGSREEPPLAVRARIEALARAPSRGRRLMRLGAAAAIFLLCAGGALIWRFLPKAEQRIIRPTDPNGSLDVQLVGDHVLNALGHQKPIEIASEDPEVVERWFASRLALAVKLPRVAGTKVAGGRLCNVAGRLTALTFIDWGDHRLSLFAMPPEGGEARVSCSEGVRGFSVCRRRVQGVEYALVSDLPPHEAARFLGHGE
jgi:anti-sigma factor RsiW